MRGKHVTALSVSMPVCLLILILLSGCGYYWSKTRQDWWVVEQVKKGEPANLLSKYPDDPSARILKGEFIEGLLWEKLIPTRVRPPRARMEISGATIIDAANLDDLEVVHEVIFANCDFQGTVLARKTIWRKGLTLDETKFQQKVDFEGAGFGNALVARNAKFRGPVSLRAAKCESELDLSGSEFQDPSEGVDCTSMSITGGALFRNVRVSGPVSFSGSKITGTIDFRQAQFDRRPDLLGMEYGGIVADHGGCGWDGVVGLLNWAVYDRDVYARLETHLTDLGNPEQAKRVYIAYKTRERKEQLSWGWAFLSFLSYHLTGYGREPWRVGIWSLFPLVAGTFVFRPQWMTPKLRASGHHRLKYNACWYSLDLFIPVVNLHMKGDWIPRATCPSLVKAYMVAHVLAGWGLVTVGLLALTGYIK